MLRDVDHSDDNGPLGGSGAGGMALDDACGVMRNPNIDDQLRWWLTNGQDDKSWSNWRQFEMAIGAPDPSCGTANPNIDDQFGWWLENKRSVNQPYIPITVGAGFKPAPTARGDCCTRLGSLWVRVSSCRPLGRFTSGPSPSPPHCSASVPRRLPGPGRLPGRPGSGLPCRPRRRWPGLPLARAVARRRWPVPPGSWPCGRSVPVLAGSVPCPGTPL